VVDKTRAQVNEPFTLTVKVEGRGNIAAVSQPPIRWPADLEVYETKQRVTGSPGGVSAKIFEVLVIPRKPGKFTIPEQELGFFSPTERAYKVKKANGIEVLVEGQASSSPPSLASGSSPAPTVTVRPSDGLLLPEQWVSHRLPSSPSARWLVLALVGLSGLALGGLVMKRLWRMRNTLQTIRHRFRRLKQGVEDDFWPNLKAELPKASSLSRDGIAAFYQKVAEGLCAALEAELSLPARAWSRAEMRNHLSDAESHGKVLLEGSLWARVENLLEYSEAVQFSGAVPDSEARQRMEGTLKEVERVIAAIRDSVSRSNAD